MGERNTVVISTSISKRQSGFTLIEVLLALLLTGAVLSVAGSIAVQTVKANQSARRTAKDLEAPLRALDQFEADLRNTITWLPREASTLAIAPTAETLCEVVTLTDWPDPESALRRRYPTRVRYRLEDDGGGTGTLNLVREVDDLTDDAAPRAHLVAERLASATLETFVGDAWTTKPSPTDVIKAMRLTLTWAEMYSTPWVRTVYVPHAETVK